MFNVFINKRSIFYKTIRGENKQIESKWIKENPRTTMLLRNCIEAHLVFPSKDELKYHLGRAEQVERDDAGIDIDALVENMMSNNLSISARSNIFRVPNVLPSHNPKAYGPNACIFH